MSSEARRELAVFGGSFDPPHLGHVLLAAYALSMSRVERVLVVPVFEHAFGKALSAFDHRVAMCKLAFRDLARVDVCELERELGGTSRTLRLLDALAQRFPAHRLRLLIGTDILVESSRWHAFEEISRRAPLLVAARAGYEGAATARTPVLPEISSSAVRDALQQGRDVSDWVPVSVREYLQEHALYGAAEGAPAPHEQLGENR
jgi:nicotinate-nucleotide adenylyltransferase